MEIEIISNEEIVINCPCFQNEKKINIDLYFTNKFIQCKKCDKYQHKKCLEKFTHMKPYYICPDCQIENLDLFLEEKQKICRILSKGKDLSNSPFLKCFFDLSNILPKISNIENEYIVLRCLKIDEEGFNTLWPGFFDIYLNKEIIQNPLKEEKDLTREIAFKLNDKNKRKTYLKIIKNKHYFRSKEQNKLLLSFNSKKIKRNDYIISIDYVKEKKIDEVIKKIPSKSINKREQMENIITQKEKVSFLDIYTDTDIINIPAKGWKCSHLCCFNLKTFLGYMEITRLFKCPFCTQKVGLIYICNEMKEIIKKYYSKERTEVILDSNYNIINEKNNEDNNIINISDDSNNSLNDINYNNIKKVNVQENYLEDNYNLDYCIDNMYKKKRNNQKFEISIKTNWNKFFHSNNF